MTIDHDIGDGANENIVFIKPEWIQSNVIYGVETILQKIKNNNLYDAFVTDKLLRKDPSYHKSEDGFTYRGDKVVIPIDKDLRGKIISSHHDSISAGHPGQAKTQEMISRSYWWPSIKKDVKAYVKGCETCQRTKIDHQPKKAPLNPTSVPDENWQDISVDLITDLPECQGYNSILNIVDMKSKAYVAVPTVKTLTSEGWANLYIKNISFGL